MQRCLRLLAAALLWQAAGCDSGAPEVGEATVVRVALEGEVLALDPHRIVEVFSQRVASQVFEGLVTLDASNSIAPALAESWDSNDRHDVWTVTLRSDARFHPHESFGAPGAREVTADDVVYSFERMLAQDAATAGALVGIVQGAQPFREGTSPTLTGVQALSDTQVEFRLTSPDPHFLYRVTAPTFAIIPREVAELGPDIFGESAVVGTGPFVYSGRSGADVTLTRNPDWWGWDTPGGGGNVSGVVFRTIREDQIRLSELRNGRVNVMYVPVTLASSVLAPGSSVAQGRPELRSELAGQFTGIAYPSLNSYFLAFNTSVVDARLRRAVAAIVNRSEIVAAVASGLAMPAAGPVPVSIPNWQPAKTDLSPDAALARRELEGMENPSIEILVHELASSERIAEVLASQLREVGISVTLTRLGFNAVVDRVLRGDYVATVLAFEYQYATPALILAGHFASTTIPMPNLFFYSEADVDAQLAAVSLEAVTADALALARVVEGRIVDDAPAVFLFQTTPMVLVTHGISGLRFNAHNVPLLSALTVQ